MTYWYETQERAMAPGIADGWPEIIKAPHTKNGRLVRRDGNPSDLLAALKLAESVYRQNVVAEGESSSVLNAMRAAIAKAEGR